MIADAEHRLDLQKVRTDFLYPQRRKDLLFRHLIFLLNYMYKYVNDQMLAHHYPIMATDSLALATQFHLYH